MAARLTGLRKARGAFLSQFHAASIVPRTPGLYPLRRFAVSTRLPGLPPKLASTSRLESTNVTAQRQRGPAEPPADPTAERPPPVNPPEGYNPPETTIPDPVTLADQWQYATSMYSRFSAQAWGMAILTGLTAFGVGWLIKGSNPLKTSLQHDESREDEGNERLVVEGSGVRVE